MNPEQNKETIEAGGTKNENNNSINDRAGLFAGIIGFGVAMLALGIAFWAIDKAKSLETQVLLLREDIRQLTIEEAKEK